MGKIFGWFSGWRYFTDCNLSIRSKFHLDIIFFQLHLFKLKFHFLVKVLKIRLALRKTGEYRGIFDCAKKLYATDGFRVFFRGYVPNIIGILPYAGIDLTVYEVCHPYAKYAKSFILSFLRITITQYKSICFKVLLIISEVFLNFRL